MSRLAIDQRKNVQQFQTQFSAVGDTWLDGLRKQGMSEFERVGFPSGKQEEWRFTNIRPISETNFELAQYHKGAALDAQVAAKASQYSFGDAAAAEIVFVNGHYDAALSRLGESVTDVVVTSLMDAIENHFESVRAHLGKYADVTKNPFVALNTGYLRDGAFVRFAKGAKIDRPVHLLFITTPSDGPAMSHPRNLILVDDHVDATVVESYVGFTDRTTSSADAAPHFTNAVTEVIVGTNSILDHYKLQQSPDNAYHVATMQTRIGKDSNFISQAATLGGQLTRNDLNCVLTGTGGNATLNGLVLARGSMHVDNHTLLDHAAPHCTSHELYKHVLDDKSTAVFKGKILVEQIAQKTDSKQSSKSLLLSDDASINAQPALEIYADDVKCTHGSTTGPVDEDMLFYLRTRGVDMPTARQLLTYAFAADITRRIRVESVRERLESFMAANAGLPQDLRITDLGSHDEKHR